jgi:type II secretory pathway pseudopilin PulG
MKTGDRTRIGQQGATFIEVLAAVGVFSLVMLGLSPSLLSARTAADLGKDRSVATTLAADKIEQIRTFKSGVLSNGTDGPLNASGGTTGGIFNRAWNVTANSPVAGLNRIEATVTWRERGGPNSVTLLAIARQ